MTQSFDFFEMARLNYQPVNQPDWAPPGGTSTSRYHEIARPFEAALLAQLRERVDADPRLWIKVYNEDAPFSSVYVGWKDDPRGGYYVGFGLEHEHARAEDSLRSFSWLQYRHEDAEGKFDREDRVGETWLDAPYARDVALHVSLLLAWLEAHRRTLATLTEAEPGAVIGQEDALRMAFGASYRDVPIPRHLWLEWGKELTEARAWRAGVDAALEARRNATT